MGAIVIRTGEVWWRYGISRSCDEWTSRVSPPELSFFDRKTSEALGMHHLQATVTMLLWMWFLNFCDNVPMDLKYVCQQYFTCMCFLGFIRYNKTFIACGFKKYYIITVFWWGKCVDLLTFEKHDIHFKSQLIHTFTESKDSNCFILYFEEIVVFWNKKKATRPLSCRSATCLLTSPCYYLNLYHLIYFLMFRPTKW